MTTPTLVDAARLAADALQETEGHVGAYLWEKHGYADDLATLRAAIDREAERQEIIEGLVEAARAHSALHNGRSRKSLDSALARYDAMKEDD